MKNADFYHRLHNVINYHFQNKSRLRQIQVQDRQEFSVWLYEPLWYLQEKTLILSNI